MMARLQAAADCMNAVLHGHDDEFSGISTDTRSLRAGELFFALQGPNFDGHDYVAKAAYCGANAAVVSKKLNQEITQLEVADTRLALGDFARNWRASKSAQVVGVTGSNGKTTLKEMIAACLRTTGSTFATAGNFNNDIGLPLMLAQITDEHEFAVMEMGANHIGEIAYLAAMAAPDVVVISNAGAAHLEGFGSLDGVSRGKGEILQTSRRPKVAVLNADDAYFDYWSSLVTDIERISFGLSGDADVRATDIQLRSEESSFRLHVCGAEIDVALALPGEHNIRNACAAAAVAHSLGVSLPNIAAAFAAVDNVDGRLQPLAGPHGSTLFDDTYNANPLSVVAAAKFIAALEGESWLVLGDMKELGDDAKELHRGVGESARASGVDRLFALGELSRNCVEGFGPGAKWYASIDALLADLTDVTPQTNVLVKGSRSMRMERIVDALRADEPVRKEA